MNYKYYSGITCLLIAIHVHAAELFSDNVTLQIIKTHCSNITPEAIARDAALSEVPVIFPQIFNTQQNLPLTINLLQKYALLMQLFFKTNTTDSYLSPLPSFLLSATSLIQPYGNKSSLFNAIDMTATTAGSVQLLKMLLTTKSTEYLTEQQKVISFLAKTDTLREKLFSSLEAMHTYENAFFYFLTADNNLTTLINTLFYSGEKSWSKYLGLDYFDTSPTAQNAYYGLNKLRSLLALGQTGSKIKNWIDFGQDLKQGGSAALQAIINSKPLEYALNMEGLQMLHDRTIKHPNPFTTNNDYIRENIIQNPQYRNVTAEFYGPLTDKRLSSIPNTDKTALASFLMHEKLSSLTPADRALAYAGLTTSILGSHEGGGIVENIGNATVYAWNDLLKGIKSAERYEQITGQLLKYMHSKLIGMGSLVRQLQNIASVLKQSPNFAKHIIGAEYITGAFDNTSSIHSSNFRYLIQQLLTNTFTGSAESWISNKGRIIATYKLMYECLTEWIPVLQAVGTLDASISCAKLYNLYQNKPETLSLVIYSNQDKAHATMTQLWDITQTPAHITQSSVTISDTNSNIEDNAVPAATNALLLGATLGLVPAKHMEVTPDKVLKLLENVVKK